MTFAAVLISGAVAQTGTNDSSFNIPDSGPNSIPRGTKNFITGSALQSNEKKIVVIGEFTEYNGVPAGHIARINSNGNTDNTFNSGTGFDNGPTAVVIQDNNRIVVGGYFSSYNGTPATRIVRLLANGSIDNSFVTGSGFDNTVNTLLLQADGKILVFGRFTHYNGTAVQPVVRLKKNGQLDNTFNYGGPGYPEEIALQPDGKLIIGSSAIEKILLTRLNTDGTADTTYHGEIPVKNPGSWDVYLPTVYALNVQADGKILAGGSYFFGNSPDFGFLKRANTDGTEDTTFHFNYPAIQIETLQQLSDGKIIAGGRDNLSFDGYEWTGAFLIRLLSNGNQDFTFVQNRPTEARGNRYGVFTSLVQQDGKVIATGLFHEINSYAANSITRFNTDGNIDLSFNKVNAANGEIRTSAVQSNGKIVIGGNFSGYHSEVRNHIARLRENGTIDNSFNTGTGTNGIVTAVAVQPNNKIIIAGNFISYNNTGVPGIFRVNNNGSLDLSFNAGTGVDNLIKSVSVQTDGKIIITGNFLTVNGTNHIGIARLNANGSVDASFIGPEFPNYYRDVYTSYTLPSGKILIGGNFEISSGSASRSDFARLNSDGTLDTTFESSYSSSVRSISLLADGRIITAGGEERKAGHFGYGFVARHFSDGTWDNSFQTGNMLGETFPVYAARVLDNGNILAAGHFTGYQGNNVSNIMLLDSLGTVDTNFVGSADATIFTTHLTADGKAIIAGAFNTYTGVARNGIARIVVNESPYGAAPDHSTISSATESTFNIYPNPAGSSVNFDNLIPGSTITVRNMVGAVIYKAQVNQAKVTLDLSKYSNGMYFITQEGNQKINTQKFVVFNN